MVVVKDLMNSDVRIISADRPVLDAVKLMVESDTGLLVVVESQEGIIRTPLGVISDTDIMKKVISQELEPRKVLVEDVMTKKLVYVEPNDTVAEAVDKMRSYHYKRLPVIEGNKLVGIISNKELINSFIHYKKELLDLAINF